MKLNVYGKEFECAKVVKGDNFIECLDEKGARIMLFQGILDFTKFSVEGGEFSEEPLDDVTQLQLAIVELAEVISGGEING